VIVPQQARSKSEKWTARLESGQPLEIRVLEPRELDWLVRHLDEPPEALETLASALEIRPGRPTPEQSVLVAWSQTLPVGRVSLRWSGPEHSGLPEALAQVAEIHGLQVVPELRSQGIGTALLRTAELLAFERERRQVGLGVAIDNHAARKLYGDLGYRAADQPSYVAHYEHRISPRRPARIQERREFWVKRFPAPTLVLFDIDGTLLTSQGAGRDSMLSAGKSLFGEEFSFDGVEVNGRLDPLIFADLALRNGLEPNPLLESRFRERYASHLQTRVQRPGLVQPLPGIEALVNKLRGTTGVTLGILSGNYAETGRMKLRAGGLRPEDFVVCAWGDDAPTRPELVPIARSRYAEVRGRAVQDENIVVIGDTPHDVECARQNGCRALGVATGASSCEELRAAGAERSEPNLAHVDEIANWILGVLETATA